MPPKKKEEEPAPAPQEPVAPAQAPADEAKAEPKFETVTAGMAALTITEKKSNLHRRKQRIRRLVMLQLQAWEHVAHSKVFQKETLSGLRKYFQLKLIKEKKFFFAYLGLKVGSGEGKHKPTPQLSKSKTYLTIMYAPPKPVRCLELGQEFPSIKAAAEALGINRGNIRRSLQTGAAVPQVGYHFYETCYF
eukprot:g7824.t1